MSDALVYNPPIQAFYGLQISDINGNVAGWPGNSYFIDVDGNTGNDPFDKTLFGDVDVCNMLCTQNTYSIGNRIWLDNGSGGGTAGDGMQNGVEPGIGGVSVSLFIDADGDGAPDTPGTPVATVTTDSNGYYRFDSVALGKYVVRVNPSNFSGAGGRQRDESKRSKRQWRGQRHTCRQRHSVGDE
ncbi:MAG: hypothetical protein HYZ49_08345 [Chloroflexi bacterium]|nr:hypothetical protein [Chloroflexota bacterium]